MKESSNLVSSAKQLWHCPRKMKEQRWKDKGNLLVARLFRLWSIIELIFLSFHLTTLIKLSQPYKHRQPGNQKRRFPRELPPRSSFRKAEAMFQCQSMTWSRSSVVARSWQPKYLWKRNDEQDGTWCSFIQLTNWHCWCDYSGKSSVYQFPNNHDVETQKNDGCVDDAHFLVKRWWIVSKVHRKTLIKICDQVQSEKWFIILKTLVVCISQRNCLCSLDFFHSVHVRDVHNRKLKDVTNVLRRSVIMVHW